MCAYPLFVSIKSICHVTVNRLVISFPGIDFYPSSNFGVILKVKSVNVNKKGDKINCEGAGNAKCAS